MLVVVFSIFDWFIAEHVGLRSLLDLSELFLPAIRLNGASDFLLFQAVVFAKYVLKFLRLLFLVGASNDKVSFHLPSLGGRPLAGRGISWLIGAFRLAGQPSINS